MSYILQKLILESRQVIKLLIENLFSTLWLNSALYECLLSYESPVLICFYCAENYSQAIEEFRSCLALQQKYLEAHDRLLAETHYHLGLAFHYDNQYDEAVLQYSKSMEVIDKRLGKWSAVLLHAVLVKHHHYCVLQAPNVQCWESYRASFFMKRCSES